MEFWEFLEWFGGVFGEVLCRRKFWYQYVQICPVDDFKMSDFVSRGDSLTLSNIYKMYMIVLKQIKQSLFVVSDMYIVHHAYTLFQY